jgi:hypothetical protein
MGTGIRGFVGEEEIGGIDGPVSCSIPIFHSLSVSCVYLKKSISSATVSSFFTPWRINDFDTISRLLIRCNQICNRWRGQDNRKCFGKR